MQAANFTNLFGPTATASATPNVQHGWLNSMNPVVSSATLNGTSPITEIYSPAYQQQIYQSQQNHQQQQLQQQQLRLLSIAQQNQHPNMYGTTLKEPPQPASQQTDGYPAYGEAGYNQFYKGFPIVSPANGHFDPSSSYQQQLSQQQQQQQQNVLQGNQPSQQRRQQQLEQHLKSQPEQQIPTFNNNINNNAHLYSPKIESEALKYNSLSLFNTGGHAGNYGTQGLGVASGSIATSGGSFVPPSNPSPATDFTTVPQQQQQHQALNAEQLHRSQKVIKVTPKSSKASAAITFTVNGDISPRSDKSAKKKRIIVNPIATSTPIESALVITTTSDAPTTITNNEKQVSLEDMSGMGNVNVFANFGRITSETGEYVSRPAESTSKQSASRLASDVVNSIACLPSTKTCSPNKNGDGTGAVPTGDELRNTAVEKKLGCSTTTTEFDDGGCDKQTDSSKDTGNDTVSPADESDLATNFKATLNLPQLSAAFDKELSAMLAKVSKQQDTLSNASSGSPTDTTNTVTIRNHDMSTINGVSTAALMAIAGFDLKTFSCDICGKTFQKPSHLTRHRMIHTAVRQFKCIYCDKDFYRRDKFNEHVRMHMRKKCKVCGEMFAKKQDFAKHVQEEGHEQPATPPFTTPVPGDLGTDLATSEASNPAEEQSPYTIDEAAGDVYITPSGRLVAPGTRFHGQIIDIRSATRTDHPLASSAEMKLARDLLQKFCDATERSAKITLLAQLVQIDCLRVPTAAAAASSSAGLLIMNNTPSVTAQQKGKLTPAQQKQKQMKQAKQLLQRQLLHAYISQTLTQQTDAADSTQEKELTSLAAALLACSDPSLSSVPSITELAPPDIDGDSLLSKSLVEALLGTGSKDAVENDPQSILDQIGLSAVTTPPGKEISPPLLPPASQEHSAAFDLNKFLLEAPWRRKADESEAQGLAGEAGPDMSNIKLEISSAEVATMLDPATSSSSMMDSPNAPDLSAESVVAQAMSLLAPSTTSPLGDYFTDFSHEELQHTAGDISTINASLLTNQLKTALGSIAVKSELMDTDNGTASDKEYNELQRASSTSLNISVNDINIDSSTELAQVIPSPNKTIDNLHNITSEHAPADDGNFNHQLDAPLLLSEKNNSLDKLNKNCDKDVSSEKSPAAAEIITGMAKSPSNSIIPASHRKRKGTNCISSALANKRTRQSEFDNSFWRKVSSNGHNDAGAQKINGSSAGMDVPLTEYGQPSDEQEVSMLEKLIPNQNHINKQQSPICSGSCLKCCRGEAEDGSEDEQRQRVVVLLESRISELETALVSVKSELADWKSLSTVSASLAEYEGSNDNLVLAIDQQKLATAQHVSSPIDGEEEILNNVSDLPALNSSINGSVDETGCGGKIDVNPTGTGSDVPSCIVNNSSLHALINAASNSSSAQASEKHSAAQKLSRRLMSQKIRAAIQRASHAQRKN